MRIKKIHIENYKTYRQLDLDLEVTDDKPIILIGGGNGCGKTTLFDAIYHALYGLKIKDERQFDELFNAGVKNESGLLNKPIILEVTFSGTVLNQEQHYKLKRAYMLAQDRVLESVTLNMGGNQFTYGSGTPQSQKAQNEEIVNKIIAANLPAELSNYFLFDAMKTSELVKEEQINKLIMKNINSVMGFNKYVQLRRISDAMLADKKAERLANDNIRKEYSMLMKEKQELEDDIAKLNKDYTAAINYANEYQEQYHQLKEGKNADDITRDKIKTIEQALESTIKQETEYRQDMDTLAKDLETKVVFPKLASLLKTEVDFILHAKEETKVQRANILTNEQIEHFTRNLVKLIEDSYVTSRKIDVLTLINELKIQQESGNGVVDKFDFLTSNEVSLLDNIINTSIVNPFLEMDEKRVRLNQGIQEIPKQR